MTKDKEILRNIYEKNKLIRNLKAKEYKEYVDKDNINVLLQELDMLIYRLIKKRNSIF